MLDDPDHTFETVLTALRQMSDAELLNRWRENEETSAASLGNSDELCLRHYAFRYVAVERFGAGFGTPAMFADP